MGNIEIFVCDNCKARISQLFTIIVFTLFLLKTNYKHVKLFSNACKNGKIAMINDNYHDTGLLLLYCLLQLLLAVKLGRYRLLSKKISRLIGKTG